MMRQQSVSVISSNKRTQGIMHATELMASGSDVLVVDLDGTLLKSDILHEQIIRLLKHRPLMVGAFVRWALRGRAYLKRRLTAEVDLDVASLPYRGSVLELIRERKADGASIVLASASHQTIVAAVSDHLQLFDVVVGSDEINLKAQRKLEALRNLLGSKPFSYAGDSLADLPLWDAAQIAYAVNPSFRARRGLAAANIRAVHIRDRPPILRSYLRQARAHQWSKNLLIFLPLLAAHDFGSLRGWIAAIVAFIGFSAAASFVYVFNDFLDIESDRRHPSKRRRPMASGDLPLVHGIMLMGILAAAQVVTALASPWQFSACLAGYLGSNVAYSFWLKRLLILDVVVLSLFYVIRVVAGAAAVEVHVSPWLWAFSLFTFFGLAMVKRYVELSREGAAAATAASRAYRPSDASAIMMLGLGSSLISILVFALYISSDRVRALYRQPEILWMAVPAGLYWVARTWVLASRGEIDDDPIVFALRDRASWCVVAIGFIIFGLAL